MHDPAPSPAEMQLDRLLSVILESAVETLGFDAATISARHDGTLTTIAATNQRWIALDEAQYHAGDGPCVTVLDPHDPILLEDISTVDGWDEFRATAEHVAARQPGTPSAEGFAKQLAVAMQAVELHKVTAKLADGLAAAMKSRATIEQAKGILIAQYGGSPDEAFERLRDFSQHSNIKLRDVAQRIVDEHAVRANGKADIKDFTA
jgi:hypothetical protein